jgi:Fe-S oxidoreductase
MESPRGRIYLVKAAKEERIPINDTFLEHIFLCLDCRACETACPSGVQYGKIIEAARGEATKAQPGGAGARFLRWLVFRQIFPFPGRLRALAGTLRFYQSAGLQAMVRRSGILKLFGQMGRAETFLPKLSQSFYAAPKAEVVPARGETRHRVGFVTGCIMPYFFGETNRATVSVLTRNGCEVVVPKSQRCCGALGVHAGDRDTAKDLARRNIDAFEPYELDVIISNAAGCGTALKEYDVLLENDPVYAERAQDFSERVKDISEFLAEIEVDTSFGAVNKRVTYQDACHLAHGQRVRAQPRSLLQAVPGLEFVEMKNSDHCCGSAGVYNIVQADMAQRVVAPKIKNIENTEADYVVVGNPGCMLQMDNALAAEGVATRSIHTMELLEQAYQAAESGAQSDTGK